MQINQRKAGVVLSYTGEAVRIAVSLIYTPVMLRLLGQSEYGLYQLVYSVVSYLSLLSLGFGSSYMRFFSRYRARRDDDGIARLNGMFLLVFSVMAVICILCGAAMVEDIRFIFGDGLTDGEYVTARVLMTLMVINLAITFPNSVFNCALTAHEEFLFQKLLIILQNLFSPFLTLPFLLLGWGSVGMVLVTTFLTTAVFLANMIFCLKKLRMKFVFRGIRLSLFREVWVFTFFIFLNQIIDQINWSVDNFLLGRLAGTASVAVYGVGGQINTMYMQFSTSISNVFVSRVNRIVAESDDNRTLTELFTRVGRVQFMVLALVLSGFIFLGRPFIRFWAGEGYEESYAVALLLIMPVTVPLIQNLGIEIQRAKNMHKARSVVYLCVAVGNIFLSIPLICRFGPAGAACGTAVSLVLGNVLFMNWYYHRKIGLDMRYFWGQIARFLPALIAPVLAGILIMNLANITSFLALMVWIVVYVLVYCASMWLLGMNSRERQMFSDPVNRLLGKWKRGGREQ